MTTNQEFVLLRKAFIHYNVLTNIKHRLIYKQKELFIEHCYHSYIDV